MRASANLYVIFIHHPSIFKSSLYEILYHPVVSGQQADASKLEMPPALLINVSAFNKAFVAF